MPATKNENERAVLGGRGRSRGACRFVPAGRPGLRAAALAAAWVVLQAASGTPALAVGADFRFGAWSLPGEFGSDDRNQLWQIPLQIVITRQTSRFTITIPQVGIRRTGNVTWGADGPIVLGVGGPGRPAYQTAQAGEGRQGLGDILLSDEIYVLRGGKGKRPLLAWVLDLKVPTADEKKGLGTGKRDWSAGLSYVQPLGKVVQILADASYRFMGDPEGIDFKDRPRYAGGLAFVASHFTVRTIYETMRPALPKVPLFDSSGTPVGVETVEDRRLARVDLTLRSLLGGTTRIGVTKGLNGESGDLGWLLIFSTGGQ